MWRGFLSSCKYSLSCLSESWRPNQVFHQKRNGISTISQAVTKNRMRCPVDMRRRALGPPDDPISEELGTADIRNITESDNQSRCETHCHARSPRSERLNCNY